MLFRMVRRTRCKRDVNVYVVTRFDPLCFGFIPGIAFHEGEIN